MKISSLLAVVLTGTALFIAAQGCSSTNDAAPGGIHCTPGNYVFCRCQDRAEGTKLCRPDGTSFEACTTGASGECVGGEDLTDPGTGNPVPPDQIPDPPQEAGAPGSPVDACPGKPTSIGGGAAVVIEGDTTGAASDLKGKLGACAVGDGGPDHVYRLQPTGSGSLSVTVQGLEAMNPLIYLRSTCADEASQTECAPPLGAGKLVQFQANVITGHEYFLVVDGASASAGKYKLTLKLTTGSFCGDGKVDQGEACDDINKVDNDGCSPSCKAVNGDPAGADCTTPHKVDVWKGITVSGTGSTNTYGNTFTKPGTSCDPSIGSNIATDHVYEVTAHSAGTLKVTMTPTDGAYNVQLVARKTCNDPLTQTGDTINKCNANGAGVAEVITVPVQTNEKIYVAADGALNGKGAYTIKFELP